MQQEINVTQLIETAVLQNFQQNLSSILQAYLPRS